MDIDDMGGDTGDEDYSDYSDDEVEPTPRYECVCPSYWHEFEKTNKGEHICERGMTNLHDQNFQRHFIFKKLAISIAGQRIAGNAF